MSRGLISNGLFGNLMALSLLLSLLYLIMPLNSGCVVLLFRLKKMF